MAVYVQYGCGFCSPEGWLNFDASPTLRLQKIPVVGMLAPIKFPSSVRYGDIRKGLPVDDASAQAVYCSHVLEHLALNDLRMALKNTFRVLKPGGIFRLVLPDLKILARQYVESSEPGAALVFMESTLMGRGSRPQGVSGLLRSWIGNAEHMWMWDYESLAMELGKAGFTSIRHATFGDGGDAMFEKVEDKGRWDGALGMQCSRP
jgi:SAM-dependent methyltransferase